MAIIIAAMKTTQPITAIPMVIVFWFLSIVSPSDSMDAGADSERNMAWRFD